MGYFCTETDTSPTSPTHDSCVARRKRTPGDFFVTAESLTPGLRMQGLGARYFSPTLHTWLSRDPVGDNQVYCFVMNSPISELDALGLQPAVGLTFEECNRAFDAFFFFNDDYRKKRAEMETTHNCFVKPNCICCEATEDPCGFFPVSGYDEGGKIPGKESKGIGAVKLCLNTIPSESEFRSCMAHELQHFFDWCERKSASEECIDRLCSEMRAARAEGRCNANVNSCFSEIQKDYWDKWTKSGQRCEGYELKDVLKKLEACDLKNVMPEPGETGPWPPPPDWKDPFDRLPPHLRSR